jgi:Uma2 family endonuclease
METDRHGHIIMSPPASFEDGGFQAEISHLLKMHLPTGKICGECPISTPDGVKVADAAWISREKLAKIGRHVCLLKAPEICIEILSPSNSRRELAEKKALSFAAGAEEVWFCDEAGRMTFYIGALSTGEPTSRLCPSFPAVVLE